MKANKKGISLIVLIITIVVIIILAATIILSITKSNPIRNANRAVDQSDMKTAQEAFILWLGDRWAQPALQYEVGCYYSGKVTAEGKDNLQYKFEKFTSRTDTTGKPVKEAGIQVDGAWQTSDKNQEFATADFGLEQFDYIVIENNIITEVKKDGVVLEYDTATGVVTSYSATQSNNDSVASGNPPKTNN